MNLLRRVSRRTRSRPARGVTIDGYQSRDGALRANGQTLVYDDGRQFYIGYLGLLGTAESGDRPAQSEQ